jgi:hypothetical protein
MRAPGSVFCEMLLEERFGHNGGVDAGQRSKLFKYPTALG